MLTWLPDTTNFLNPWSSRPASVVTCASKASSDNEATVEIGITHGRT
jgi:hypothetical protein